MNCAETVKIGCFQILILIFLGINYVIVSTTHGLPTFYNHSPKYYCESDNSPNKSYGCLPTNDVSNDNGTFCTGEYRFDGKYEQRTIVTDWQLICERSNLLALSTIVYYIGVALGAWVTGILIDRIGRLPVLAVCLYIQGALAVTLYVVQDYPVFLAIRGLQGFFVQGLQSATLILALELFPTKCRTIVCFAMYVAWAIGLVFLTGLNYLISDWRIIQLAISIPTAFTMIYIWIVPESPRWLVAKGKSTEAEIVIENIIKYNGCCTRNGSSASSKAPEKPERKFLKKKDKTGEKLSEDADILLQGSRTIPSISINAAECYEQNETEAEASVKDPINDEPLLAQASSSAEENQESGSISKPQNYHDSPTIKVNETRGIIIDDGINDPETQDIKDNLKAGDDDDGTRKTKVSWSTKKHYSIIACEWFAISAAHYTFSTFPLNLNKDRHVTFALFGALEIASYAFSYIILSRYGRRVPMCIYQLLTGAVLLGIASLILLPIPNFFAWTDQARIFLLFLGKVTVISSTMTVYLYTVEIFPTLIRGAALGLSVAFGAVGFLSALLLLSMDKHVSNGPSIGSIGGLCIVVSLLGLLLPETSHNRLPDTAQDMSELLLKRNTGKPEVIDEKALREKLFSEDWVEAGNGIIVNFADRN